MFTRIAATGHFLPAQVVTNDDLAARGLDTSDAWIRQRTGIERRRIAGGGETTASMAAAAGREALARAGLEPGAIDAVIVATTTPDRTFPATAVEVQAALGVPPGPAFDLQAVCSGFVYGLVVADSLIKTGAARRVLLIGADRFSALLDWTDRGTCVLFGDGAGAAVLEASDTPGLLAARLYADGRKTGLLYADGGPGSTGTVGKARMVGPELFREAVSSMAAVGQEVLDAAGAAADWVIPHQANIRIIEAVAQRLGIPMARVVTTVANHGNTSAASIPLALHAAAADGRVQRGQTLLLAAMGAGLTWGAAAVRF
ncbi:MAG: ketoacyl-ACP synthase III [Alphaproteobacteria bacterium]|jgi:3-oxoacyl-[acyl-carrier-protein] synthase-3|nr:ketoacyl-ACP synthase III [Alphaproteobacteria bacterium]